MSDAAHTVAAIFRIELPKLVARLARVVRAEELAQDAMVIALERWPADGVPDNPGASRRNAATILRELPTHGSSRDRIHRERDARRAGPSW